MVAFDKHIATLDISSGTNNTIENNNCYYGTLESTTTARKSIETDRPSETMAARKRILLRADHSRLSAATARTTTATATAACRSQSSRRWSRTVLATLTTMGAVMAASLATAWVPLLLSTPPTHRAPSRRTPLSSGSTTSASSGSVRRGTFGQQESSIRETTTSIASATTTIDSATVGGEQTPAQTTGTDPVLSSPFRGALSLSMAELSDCLGGNGRAKLVWDCYKHGVDPALYFATTAAAAATNNSNGTGVDCPANPTTSISTIPEGPAASSSRKEEPDDISLSQLFPGSRRSQRLGSLALQRLETLYADYSSGSNQNNSDTGVNRDKQNNDNENPSPTHRHRIGAVQGGVATLSHVSQSQDGTTKLLLTLHDDTAVETVIIPWNGIRSTLCISSQVGCRQACTFCATGRMGRVRSLTTDEILAQMFFALQTIRRRQQGINNNTLPLPLPPITNIGMYNVVCSYSCMTKEQIPPQPRY